MSSRAEKIFPMNKSEQINAMVAAGLTAKDAEIKLDAAMAAVSEAPPKGESVQRGWLASASFSIREHAAGESRRPRTVQIVKIEAPKSPVLWPAKR